MNRQAENTRRVEESIKGTKSNPRWFVPLFCALMIIGLVWAVVYYLTTDYPIPHIGAWNLGHRVRNHHGRFHYDHVVALSRFSPFRLSHRSLCKRRRVHCDPASLLSASTTLLTASASPRFSFRKMRFPVEWKAAAYPADYLLIFRRPNQHVVAAFAWWCRTGRRRRRRRA